MKVIEVNEGTKIPYSVNGNKITFDDELMLNLEKYERDYDVCIDVCIDKFGMLTTGLGVAYVSQIEIPARQYIITEEEKQVNNPDYYAEDMDEEQNEFIMETVTMKEAVPFSMSNVTLKLYAV